MQYTPLCDHAASPGRRSYQFHAGSTQFLLVGETRANSASPPKRRRAGERKKNVEFILRKRLSNVATASVTMSLKSFKSVVSTSYAMQGGAIKLRPLFACASSSSSSRRRVVRRESPGLVPLITASGGRVLAPTGCDDECEVTKLRFILRGQLKFRALCRKGRFIETLGETKRVFPGICRNPCSRFALHPTTRATWVTRFYVA